MILEEVWSFCVPYLGGGAYIEIEFRREKRGPDAHVHRHADRGDSAEPQTTSDSRPAGPKKTPQSQRLAPWRLGSLSFTPADDGRFNRTITAYPLALLRYISPRRSRIDREDRASTTSIGRRYNRLGGRTAPKHIWPT